MKKKMVITSKTDNLQMVEKYVDDFSAFYDVDKDIYGNLLISALEATNNAITHGNKLVESKNVELIFAIDNGKIILTVKDEGIGFDYKNLPDPTISDNIECMSGRGVFLMTMLSDTIEFENNGSLVKMTFLLKKNTH